MTRNEAINIYMSKSMSHKLWDNFTEREKINVATAEMEALAALGLIKFNKPFLDCPKEITKLLHESDDYRQEFGHIAPIRIVQLIEEAGYKLVKI